ncbi:hypothetical protein [Pseudomonas sp. BDPW]|uniref:hypothetical protein n=1 Tax=Pseudomonas sp. BDPW TaxID=2806612 RepID=UPI00193C1050|nr:hypothetical protein [Pseudomonas sp. BDPW]MBM2596509.1 hypothetical protein [Pseudomonas sp. BDPW]
MSKVQRFWCDEARNIRCVREDDFDALEAEAQALREEVARGNRITLAMALDIAAVGVALGIPGEQQEGGTGEFIEAIQNLQKELEALRARVVVVPDAANDRRKSAHYCRGWNACLDELARINGLTVSEGLLRRVCAEQPATCCMDDELSWRRDLDSALIELRALLNQDKENGNG